MIDPLLNRTLRPLLTTLARPLVRRGVRADQITLTGFVVGLLAVPALAQQWYALALVCILSNRIADGLDGAVAR
ncbi:MAG TPA: CDP-alcohol phosphatidyltransferase family protein, partial [Pseudidiomarina sp.]|nr:CDP-alcohol phosphatidyltransferase family protein [Pseudidiomarina sp.]